MRHLTFIGSAVLSGLLSLPLLAASDWEYRWLDDDIQKRKLKKEPDSQALLKTPMPVIEQVQPSHKKGASNSGQEGWARVSFSIDPQGKVIAPKLVDSSGQAWAEESLMKVIEQWRFKPWESHDNSINIRNVLTYEFFVTPRPKEPRDGFKALFVKAAEAVEAGNPKVARQYLEKIVQRGRTNLFEDAYFRLLSANVAMLEGDETTELYYRTSYLDNYQQYLHVNKYQFNQARIIELAARAGKYQLVLDTYEEFAGKKVESTLASTINTYVNGVAQQLNSGASWAAAGQIGNQGYWNHKLFRHHFSLLPEHGEITRLEIHCDNHRQELSYKAEQIHFAPVEWGQCELWVLGKENTQFHLIEVGSS
ncbi:energy transducer TonB [Paraferrimonas sedimenticola]|uniref:TonB C-terminal domain-containing protein n=1 Tax=Paraferrimonas sedimenticola TaxID=375674 RepID=A0AA37RUK0_9GAMM|nr:energy transducer TonB [Paraferrimonas sedimenticola]GLP95524.1 hypothetical protein GCM10007895_08300 [Paraferrimonas sedimenticola]